MRKSFQSFLSLASGSLELSRGLMFAICLEGEEEEEEVSNLALRAGGAGQAEAQS